MFPRSRFRQSRFRQSRFRQSREKGLSLIELLVAVALLAVIAIGILPLLMRALADRNRGWEATTVSNFAQSRLEPLLAMPYESDALILAPGLTEKVSSHSWTEGKSQEVGDNDLDEGWTDKPAHKGTVLWTRNTYVRWYNVDDLKTPLSGDVDSTEVGLKEIQVQLKGVRKGGGLGAGQELWIRVFKAF